MKKIIKKTLNSFGVEISKKKDEKELLKIYSRFSKFTMIPTELYVTNLRLVKKFIPKVDGDIVECGVWRGGMIAGISALLGMDRYYHLFDSFEGLPDAKDIDGQAALEWQKNEAGEYYFDNCTAEVDYAKRAMEIANVTDYVLHEGWFDETLPNFQIGDNKIALLRLDGDWYDSTLVCLKYLYPKVAKNGLILIDDYYAWDGCSKALHDYLSSIKSNSKISSYNGVCYIVKNDE